MAVGAGVVLLESRDDGGANEEEGADERSDGEPELIDDLADVVHGVKPFRPGWCSGSGRGADEGRAPGCV